MRHRIDISPQAQVMLRDLAERLGMLTISTSGMAEICIQSMYERAIQGKALQDEINPISTKLDEIKSMLQEVLVEI